LTSVQTWEESEALVVRVDAGISDTKVRRFRAGTPVATMTVGSQGAWKVEAPGVASVHAYLRFDGHQLLVATSDPRRPVVVDGTALPETWSPLQPPCVLSLGQANLSVHCAAAAVTPASPAIAAAPPSGEAEDEQTCRKSSPIAGPAWHGAPQEAEPSPMDVPPAEPTRLQFGPLESPAHLEPSAPLESLAHLAPAHLEPSAQPTRAVQVSSLLPTSLEPSLEGEGELGAFGSLPPPFEQRRLRWQRRVQAAGVLLGLAVIVVGVYRLASPRSAAVPGTSLSPSASEIHASAPLPTSPAPVVTASPPAAPLLFVPGAEPGPSVSGSGARLTPERRAADAFAAGDFATALRLYRELAAAHPDQPAFRQAVKILEEK
jgi:hypothetical protein